MIRAPLMTALVFCLWLVALLWLWAFIAGASRLRRLAAADDETTS